MKTLVLSTFGIFCLTQVVHAQGAFINEFSNGASGSKEFIELVVDGGGLCSVDMRGFIFDDNNGDFGAGTGMGIAQGHIRFSSTGPWGAIPTGSIIVIYNAADPNPLMPADDPFDSNSDYVYIIPSNHADLEYCSSVPQASVSTAYTPCTYSNPANWTGIGFANGGDAAQTRDVSGAYFHGVSYGGSLNGGPEGLQVSTAGGTGKFFYFNGSNYRNVANWSVGTVGGSPAETPGAANNATNLSFITNLVCSILPVKFESITCSDQTDHVQVAWTTLSETNCDRYIIERCGLDFSFQAIGTMKGKGYSSERNNYLFRDEDPLDDISFYRLKQIDGNGNSTYSSVQKVERSVSAKPTVQYINGSLHISDCDEDASIHVYDTQGRCLYQGTLTEGVAQTGILQSGIYIVHVHCAYKDHALTFGLID